MPAPQTEDEIYEEVRSQLAKIMMTKVYSIQELENESKEVSEYPITRLARKAGFSNTAEFIADWFNDLIEFVTDNNVRAYDSLYSTPALQHIISLAQRTELANRSKGSKRGGRNGGRGSRGRGGLSRIGIPTIAPLRQTPASTSRGSTSSFVPSSSLARQRPRSLDNVSRSSVYQPSSSVASTSSRISNLSNTRNFGQGYMDCGSESNYSNIPSLMQVIPELCEPLQERSDYAGHSDEVYQHDSRIPPGFEQPHQRFNQYDERNHNPRSRSIQDFDDNNYYDDSWTLPSAETNDTYYQDQNGQHAHVTRRHDNYADYHKRENEYDYRSSRKRNHYIDVPLNYNGNKEHSRRPNNDYMDAPENRNRYPEERRAFLQQDFYDDDEYISPNQHHAYEEVSDSNFFEESQLVRSRRNLFRPSRNNGYEYQQSNRSTEIASGYNSSSQVYEDASASNFFEEYEHPSSSRRDVYQLFRSDNVDTDRHRINESLRRDEYIPPHFRHTDNERLGSSHRRPPEQLRHDYSKKDHQSVSSIKKEEYIPPNLRRGIKENNEYYPSLSNEECQLPSSSRQPPQPLQQDNQLSTESTTGIIEDQTTEYVELLIELPLCRTFKDLPLPENSLQCNTYSDIAKKNFFYNKQQNILPNFYSSNFFDYFFDVISDLHHLACVNPSSLFFDLIKELDRELLLRPGFDPLSVYSIAKVLTAFFEFTEDFESDPALPMIRVSGILYDDKMAFDNLLTSGLNELMPILNIPRIFESFKLIKAYIMESKHSDFPYFVKHQFSIQEEKTFIDSLKTVETSAMASPPLPHSLCIYYHSNGRPYRARALGQIEGDRISIELVDVGEFLTVNMSKLKTVDSSILTSKPRFAIPCRWEEHHERELILDTADDGFRRKSTNRLILMVLTIRGNYVSMKLK